MSSKRWVAFLNLSILVGTLLTVVFCKMEIRRLGYVVWKLSREAKVAQDIERLHILKYTQLTRPERIEDFAVKYFDLKKANSSQIIHLDLSR